MSRQLVFLHGRSQEHKDGTHLKAEWVDAWARGLAKSGLAVPIVEEDIRFPYYGQSLFDLVAGVPDDQIAEIIVRGAMEGPDQQEKEFIHSVLQEVNRKAKLDELANSADGEIILRGAQHVEFVQSILKAIDRHVPGGSGVGIALATSDVYQYLKNPGIRDRIEGGVRAALKRGVETVVVAHSLGTVVAYNLLRREGAAQGWKIPLLVTLGSPLAVGAIRKALRPLQSIACVGHWYNAMDERDLVALYPLDTANFEIEPTIENNTKVRNGTANRHGISGYLDDEHIAQRIHAALVAPP